MASSRGTSDGGRAVGVSGRNAAPGTAHAGPTTATTQRVRYAETDKMGVAYYSNYLVWFEVGRNHHFRELGVPYVEVEGRGLYLPVSEFSCRILTSAEYDDEIRIVTETREVRSRKIVLGYRIERGDALLAEGQTAHVCLNEDGRVTTLPGWIRTHLLGWRGRTMEMVEVYRGPDDETLLLLKSWLESHGVMCVVSSDLVHSVHPITVDGLGEARVMVGEADASRATALVEEFRGRGTGPRI